jgi:hypothetical protein
MRQETFRIERRAGAGKALYAVVRDSDNETVASYATQVDAERRAQLLNSLHRQWASNPVGEPPEGGRRE